MGLPAGFRERLTNEMNLMSGAGGRVAKDKGAIGHPGGQLDELRGSRGVGQSGLDPLVHVDR